MENILESLTSRGDEHYSSLRAFDHSGAIKIHCLVFKLLGDGGVTPLVLIFARYVLSMFKIDQKPLHTLIGAIECIWTIETAKNLAKC